VGEAHAEDALARLSSAGVSGHRVGTVGPASASQHAALVIVAGLP
jgi:hypothetical protein